MALKKIRLGFGSTESNSIPVTRAQVTTILAAINDSTLTSKEFSGHITLANGSVNSSELYTLGQAGITYHGSCTKIEYSVSASKTTNINEGESVTFTITGTEQVLASAYRFEIVNVNITGGSITANEVKSLCSFEGNVMKLAKSGKSSTWYANISLNVYPVFEDSDKKSITLSVKGYVPATSFTINAPASASIINGTPATANVTLSYLPSGCSTPETLPVISCSNSNVSFSNITATSFTVKMAGTSGYTATISVTAAGVTKSASISVAYKKVPAITITGNDSFIVKRGNGRADYQFAFNPSDYNVDVSLLTVTSSNANTSISNLSLSGFRLTVSGTTETTSTVITAKFSVDGNTVTVTKTITIEYSSVFYPFIIINPNDVSNRIRFAFCGGSQTAISYSYAVVSDYTKGSMETYDFNNVPFVEYTKESFDAEYEDIVLSPGQSLMFYIDKTYNPWGGLRYLNFDISDKDVDFDGDIMSLIGGVMKEYAFYWLFHNSTAITKAPALPSETLEAACYQGMFERCYSLTTAPELPATNLATSCYCSMFEYCRSLIEPPSLPATSLYRECYSRMFASCINLSRAPELPATTLKNLCYSYMFISCTSLIVSPTLNALELVEGCYNYMFNGCTALIRVTALFLTSPSSGEYTKGWLGGISTSGKSFYKNRSATWTDRGANAVPVNWNVYYV